MQKLAVSAAVASSRHAAPPRFPAGSLLRRLPARLTDLLPAARAQLGALLDRQAVRFVVDSVDGATIVARRGRA